MSEKNDLLTARLKEVQKSKEEAEKNKPGVVQSIVTGEDEKPNFMKMAAALKKQGEEKKSSNDGFTKDTLYIRDDLYNAMQALVLQSGGLKKDHVNAAYELYLTKMFKEMDIDISEVDAKGSEGPIRLVNRKPKNKKTDED